jgi:hypothetical protein
MIKSILKRREESNTYLTHVSRHRQSRQIAMKTDESSSFIHFNCDLSTLGMSTAMSQVGVALFPSF